MRTILRTVLIVAFVSAITAGLSGCENERTRTTRWSEEFRGLVIDLCQVGADAYDPTSDCGCVVDRIEERNPHPIDFENEGYLSSKEFRDDLLAC